MGWGQESKEAGSIGPSQVLRQLAFSSVFDWRSLVWSSAAHIQGVVCLPG